MYKLLHDLLWGRNKLGAKWLPMPTKLRVFFSRFPKQKQIHIYAMLFIGQDISYLVDDDVACSEVVTRIVHEIDPEAIDVITGTWTLWDRLRVNRNFRLVAQGNARPGDIVLSPTGSGNGKIRGHVGIVTYRNKILSNVSATGNWKRAYTIDQWNARYRNYGGFPVYYYQLIG